MSALELHPVIAPQPGRLEPVARGVHWLRMPVAFAPGHVNLWAIEDMDDDGPCWTLVDAGFPDAGTRANWSAALTGDLAGRPVRRILITHCHPDHFGLGEWLAQQTGARIWMSLGEYMTAQAWFGTVPATETGRMADFFLQHGLAPEQAAVMRDEGGRYRRVVGEVPVAIRRILPGETLHIGGDSWTAIVGYGHSPEHLSFHRARDPVLIAGDMLLPRISPNTPTLAFEPETDAVGHYLESIERFRLLAWSTLVLPAHGDPYRGVVARIDALQAHHAERLAQIVDLCAQPKTAADLLPALFKRELDSFQTRFAMGEVIAHLNHLWQAGRLRRLPMQDGVIRYTLPLPVSGGAIAMNKAAAKDATPTEASALPDPAEVAKTYAQVAERASKLLGDHVQRQLKRGITPPADELGIAQAFMDMTSRLLSNPYKLAQAQMGLVWDYYTLWQQSMLKFMGVDAAPVVTPIKGDNRFRGEDWQSHFLFDFFKQSYLISARHIHDVVSNVEGMDEHTLQKVNFFTRQTINAFSPSNFAMTNPEVLRETVRSHGQNLLKGFNNLLRDIEDGDGQLRVRMTDTTAFELGRNVATTQGKVVGENALMQLLQFNPTTEQQFKRPLLIVPPWINKYYILDLRDSNSYIKWATDQGHTVFVISWVNPDEKLAQLTFEDYVEQGPLAALDMITKQTGESEVNAAGYCLGGTLLATTLAYLSAKKDKRIASATFFTTLIDFSEPGELGVFIDEKAVEGLEKKMFSRGYLEGSEMAGTFNMLRSNDLIWSFVVNNYLMGREPFPFDLLYWNSDSTRMPACMHSYYLRQMYIHNKLREPGGITVLGEAIDIRKIKQPVYFISAIEDHIAPWKSTYTGATLLSGPTRFVLGGSGHIAGIVNPPAANKYGYWTNAAPKLAADADAWFEGCTQHTGSWWTDWQQWVTALDADMVPARDPAKGKLKAIEDAPGRYAKLRLDTMKG